MLKESWTKILVFRIHPVSWTLTGQSLVGVQIRAKRWRNTCPCFGKPSELDWNSHQICTRTYSESVLVTNGSIMFDLQQGPLNIRAMASNLCVYRNRFYDWDLLLSPSFWTFASVLLDRCSHCRARTGPRSSAQGICRRNASGTALCWLLWRSEVGFSRTPGPSRSFGMVLTSLYKEAPVGEEFFVAFVWEGTVLGCRNGFWRLI